MLSVSTSLDSDQAWRHAGPDLGPNYYQNYCKSYQQTTFFNTSRNSVPEVIKLCFLRPKFQLLIKTKIPTNKVVFCFKSLICCIYHAYKCLECEYVLIYSGNIHLVINMIKSPSQKYLAKFADDTISGNATECETCKLIQEIYILFINMIKSSSQKYLVKFADDTIRRQRG